MKHKKNDLLNNLGKADVTSHVNFNLLREYFKKWIKCKKDNYSERIFKENGNR